MKRFYLVCKSHLFIGITILQFAKNFVNWLRFKERRAFAKTIGAEISFASSFIQIIHSIFAWKHDSLAYFFPFRHTSHNRVSHNRAAGKFRVSKLRESE